MPLGDQKDSTSAVKGKVEAVGLELGTIKDPSIKEFSVKLSDEKQPEKSQKSKLSPKEKAPTVIDEVELRSVKWLTEREFFTYLSNEQNSDEDIAEFLTKTTNLKKLFEKMADRYLIALQEAARYGRVKTTQLLWEAGEHVMGKEIAGWAALNMAVYFGHVAVSRFLLNQAEVTKCYQNDIWKLATDPAHKSSQNKAEIDQLIQCLAAKLPTPKTHDSLHHLAADEGWKDAKDELFIVSRTKAMESLLKMGVKADAVDWKGWTPLMLVARNDKLLDMAKLLSQNGATINATSGYKDNPYCVVVTALCEAAKYGQKAMVEYLLSRSAYVGCITSNWSLMATSPLIVAAANGHAEIVKILLTHGSEHMVLADTRDHDGNTALIGILSAKEDISDENRVNIVTMLLEAKADVNIRNQSGITAFMAVHTNQKINSDTQNKIKGLLLAAKAELPKNLIATDSPLMSPSTSLSGNLSKAQITQTVTTTQRSENSCAI